MDRDERAKRRAWWAHRQGLDGTLEPTSEADVLARTGWARSVGGSNPYLTLHARMGADRESVDKAVQALELHELPSARGCTYVLPAAHFALGLQVGRDAGKSELALLDRLGVPRAEIDTLADAVLSVVGAEPMNPADLKAALGDRVRSLGEEGRKRGASTTLPAALGLLQSSGALRRVPVDGRLDQQRFGYVRWDVPASGHTDEEARAELARLYFEWAGPASLAHFRWFSAFSAKDAKAAVADLDLTDAGDGLLLPADRLAEYQSFAPPTKPDYRLLAGIDGLVLLRRDHRALIDGEPALPGEPPVTAAKDLTDHPITDRGRIVGLWQFDPAAERVVWTTFAPPADPDALRASVHETQTFVREQLGDARSMSLDSPKSRAPRLAALREAAG
jgi:winged helix DNA-binding protein